MIVYFCKGKWLKIKVKLEVSIFVISMILFGILIKERGIIFKYIFFWGCLFLELECVIEVSCLKGFNRRKIRFYI